MKYLMIWAVLPFCLSLTGCTNKKTTTSQTADSTRTAAKMSLPDSIERAISLYDRRLDIKMRRKTYEPEPGSLVTLQKWFENGDTTRLIKTREEVITGTTKMTVIQYHYLNQQLAEIHDYLYDKACDGKQKQCMQEAKYYFKKGQLTSAVRRESMGTNDSVPVIERATFQPFTPDKSIISQQQQRVAQIDRKYASLPYQRLGK